MKFEPIQFPSRRSNMIAFNGLVATSQPIAAQAGLNILQNGGHAIDAAIATVATLCVTEPCSTGIGGDAFALIWDAKSKQLYGLNSSGPAPATISGAKMRSLGYKEMPTLGGRAVTVPGAVRGWEAALARFGTLPLSKLLEPAYQYAQDGFPVSQRIGRAWARSEAKMSRHPDSKRVWLPNGRPPQISERFQNKEFAQTLKSLMDNGPDAFYTGPIAQAICDTVQKDGGFLSIDDLANYQPEWVNPISARYGDFTFHEIPPNGQGLTALLALNIAQQFDLPSMKYGSVDYLHTLIEAMKLAFIDAHAFIADPLKTSVPIEQLLSSNYTKERAKLIGKEALLPTPGNPSLHGDTVYLTVADKDGNMVSWIQSLYMGFGSGLTAGKTGIQLQNRGANFSLEEGHPNELAPNKRPFHTIIPGFITHKEEAWASFGVMGGFMQPQGHLQVGLNLTQFAHDPQTALDAPRFNWIKGKTVALEDAFPAAIKKGLRQRGHHILPPRTARKIHFGGGQIIVRHPETGALIGGSEPRADGAAIGW